MTRTISGLAAMLVVCFWHARRAADPLPSWNDGPTKAAIVDFVAAVTTAGGADFVPEPERIAVFDNDGTLWVEQPIYTQLAFAFDRVKAMAPQHPEWRTNSRSRRCWTATWRPRRRRRERPRRDRHGDPCRHDRRGLRRDVTDWIATARTRASTGPIPS